LQDLRIAELQAVAGRVLEAVAGDEPFDAAVPTFLLRHYLTAEAGDGLGEALGVALARALALAADAATVLGRAAWLTLLVDATAVADDERIRPAAAALLAALQADWPAQTRVDEASASAEACLRAAAIVDGAGLLQAAIDQLERSIGASYRPGDGLVRDRDGIRVRGSAADHVRGASALLTAFELTGRLPYSMLAEELMAVAVREPFADVVLQCEASSVLCRLAALHDDEGYRAAAVIAEGADYLGDASRLLAAASARALSGTPSEAAAYGIALRERLQYVR
jgi:hypothetical protein